MKIETQTHINIFYSVAANLPALLNPGAPPPPSQADLPQPSAESANTAETTDLTEAFPQIGAENGCKSRIAQTFIYLQHFQFA